MTIDLRFTISAIPPAVYWRGLFDYESAFRFDPPYNSEGYFPRNWTPPNMGQQIPEVGRMENGTQNRLTEFWEWTWFWSFYGRWKIAHSSTTLEEAKGIFKKYTRGNAFATNKHGWNNGKHSWVLDLNPDAEAMRIEETICPGNNLFRATREIISNETLVPIWNLDFTRPPVVPPGMSVDNAARAFAATLPNWLVHIARIVWPIKIGNPITGAPNGIFLVTNLDCDFPPPPLLTSTGRQATVDGFSCRENFIKLVRVSRLT